MIAQTITMFETDRRATTLITEASTHALALDRHRRPRVASSD